MFDRFSAWVGLMVETARERATEIRLPRHRGARLRHRAITRPASSVGRVALAVAVRV